VQANERDEMTYLTFTAPFELPGVALPPGTYLFRHPDASSSQHVVQVSSEDGKMIYGTFLTLPFSRQSPTSQPSVIFQETAKGAPEAVEAWFYPGHVIGEAFVYPDDHANRRGIDANGN